MLQSGFLAIIICLVIAVADGFAILFYLRWTNVRRDEKGVVETTTLDHQEKPSYSHQIEILDTTDLKNKEFRYVY
jgi:hypothetical protein